MRIQTVNSSQTYLLPLFCVYEQIGLCVGRPWRLANTIRTQTTSRSVKVVVLNIDQKSIYFANKNNPLLVLNFFFKVLLCQQMYSTESKVMFQNVD